MRKRTLEKSREWQRRQVKVIAQGALTNSKRAEHYPPGYPTHMHSGKGCIVQDVDGNCYIDYVMGLGGVGVLGYGDERIQRAVLGQLQKGSLFSVASTLEVEVAERLVELFPWLTKWRFFKTGSEACSAALRIARSATNTTEVYSCGYHGWHDEFCSLTYPARGILDHPAISNENMNLPILFVEAASLDKLGESNKTFRCDKVLVTILDEIVTGFRFPRWSLCNYKNRKPDILCLGKAIASGLPLAAVGMTEDVAKDSGEWFCSSTFAGETLALAACKETMNILTNDKPLDWLWERGGMFREKFNSITKEIGVEIIGYNTRGMLEMTKPAVALFCQQMMKAGVFLGKAWFYTFPHVDVDDQVLSITQDVVNKIKKGGIHYEGNLPVESFKR